MNIQDIRYISAIAEAGSISKAADRLLVAQPSLSKCIQKVEKEYGVTLFTRTRGSSSELTEEGELFLEMAREMLTSHDHFEEQIRHLKLRKKNSIVFGIPVYRSLTVAGPLIKEIYQENEDYTVEIQVKSTPELKRGVLNGTIDMVQLGTLEEDERLHYETLYESWLGIYLRTGSPIAEKAVRLEGIPYPVLRMENLAGEPFVTNLPGNSTRSYQDAVLEKTGVSIQIIEAVSHHSRLAMVETGKANLFTDVNHWHGPAKSLVGQLYYLHPDQNLTIKTSLACRPGFQRDPRFQTVYKCLKRIYSERQENPPGA